ncbi:MAG: hypothetical protein K2N51_09680 [Lachnospiraceae bacterium]|nr:hypothetical protein [Lachnospiraceae bacterium]
MEFEKAIYSYKAVNECIPTIKGFTTTVQKRAEHFSKCFELEKLYNMCFEKTGCLLFEWEYTPMKDYHKAVNDGLCDKVRKVRKKEYDELLKRAARCLKNEILGIYKMMEYGEVNTTD